MKVLEQNLIAAQADYRILKEEKIKVEGENSHLKIKLNKIKDDKTNQKEFEVLNKELLLKLKAKSELLNEKEAKEHAYKERIKDLEIS